MQLSHRLLFAIPTSFVVGARIDVGSTGGVCCQVTPDQFVQLSSIEVLCVRIPQGLRIDYLHIENLILWLHVHNLCLSEQSA